MDLRGELDQLTNDKEDTESDDWLQDGPLEDIESTVQKRRFGHGTKHAQRKRFLSPSTARVMKQINQTKRLFCNVGGC